MLQYYLGGAGIPAQIVVQQPNEALAAALGERRGGRVELRAAERGDKARCSNLAERNAPLALDQEKLKSERRRQQRVEALDGLQQALKLDALAAAHRVLRHLDADGDQHHGVDGGLRGRRAEEVRLPALQRARQHRGGARRLRGDGGDPRPRLAQWEAQQDLSPHDPKRNESFATLPNLIVIDGGPGQLAAGPARARRLPAARRRHRLAGQAPRGGLHAGPAGADRARPRHARAPAAPARPRRGAPVRDHPSPQPPRQAADDVDPRRPPRDRACAQARAAPALRLARGLPGRVARELEAVPGLPGKTAREVYTFLNRTSG